MAYRPKDIYRGRRKFRVPLNIFLFVLVFLTLGGVTMFYVLQRYMVYDANGEATLQLPFGQEEEAEPEAELPYETAAPTVEPVAVEIIWEDPDFTEVDLGGWEDLKPLRGRFVPLREVTDATSFASAVSGVLGAEYYDTAILEMKDRSGQLAWPSTVNTAISFGTAGATDVTEAIARLHEGGKRVAAQMSCFADTMLAQRNWTVALQSNGAVYKDANDVLWVDPYNRTVRTYLTDLARELASMGFDEIILADLYHPMSEAGFTYTVTLQTAPDPVVAVCQMGRRVVNALEGTGAVVSARLDPDSFRGGLGAYTGQDVGIFWRLFARLYCSSWADVLESDTELAASSMNGGSTDQRFVPILGYIPEDSPPYVISG